MKRRIIAASLFILSTASFLLAGRQGSLLTTDGKRLNGEITETRESVTIVRHGVSSVFPRDEVAEIDYATYAERFERAINQLKPNDVDGRIVLAREAFDQREYELAQRAVDEAIDINPVNLAALEISRAIANQRMLEGAATKPTTGKATSKPSTNPTQVDAAERKRYRGLSPEQVNVVRQMELQAEDQVRVQFRNNARKAYVDSQPGMSFRDFNTLTDTAQAIQIIQKGSTEIKNDVIILSDPQSIRTFGRRMHTAIVQGCATSQCHGGKSAGEFRLVTGTPDQSTLVTNFYLLNHFTKLNDDRSGDVFAPTVYLMVDRGHAKASMLYQFSLPRAKARLKHPEVRGWDGIFNNETDKLAVEMETWMDKELIQITPNYGFDFTLGPTTKPSEEQPATGPSQPAEPSEPATKPLSAPEPATKPAE